MIYQRFVPEGWEGSFKKITKDNLDQALINGHILEGKVQKCDSNYNLYINFDNNITGVIPKEEVEALNVDENGFAKPNIYIGKVNKFVQFKVKSVDEENNKYILSRKDVEEDALNWIKNEVDEGQIVNGIVKSIKPYGAFVEIGGGVSALLHIEDMSVCRIKTPFERLKIGQKANFMVKSINRESNRILLSYKELLGSWEDNIKNFDEGSTVIGKVRETEKSKNGIFIELAPNLVGLAEYKEGIEYGQNVSVYIKKIIPEKKKIKLIIV